MNYIDHESDALPQAEPRPDILTPDEWGLVALMLQQVHARGGPYERAEIRGRLAGYFGAGKADDLMAYFDALGDA